MLTDPATTDRDGLYLLISPKGGIAFKYLEKACAKLRVRTQIEAVALAVRKGLIDPEAVVTDLSAQEDPWAEVALILRDRWASNPVSDEALVRARLAIVTAGRLRPKAPLFWGVPNAGKTALKVKLLREISQTTFLPGLPKVPVVLMVEAPVEAEEARLYEAKVHCR